MFIRTTIDGEADPETRKRLSMTCVSVRLTRGRIDHRLWGKRPLI